VVSDMLARMKPPKGSPAGWVLAAALAAISCATAPDARLAGSWRGPERNGWIPIRLQGSPTQIGFQHGYLLAREIADALAVVHLALPRDTRRDWTYLRSTAKRLMWPRVEQEYRDELQGMAAGLAARGVQVDVTDLVVLNANLELPYFTDSLDRGKRSPAPEHCSAFVATGSWTRYGTPVIAHSNWSGYLEGERWNIIFDVRPERGNRILMDGFPGLIHSGDDFGMNSAGIVITETTISRFHGFDPGGIPEFTRARKAMQYASTIDDFVRIMRDGNNGGYANAWLVADTRRNEIARLELGLANVTLERTRDGYFVGSNFPVNPALARAETDFPAGDPGNSANARHARWEQLMAEFKGRIDVGAARRFLADHYDAYENRPDAPSERTLCGHVELSPRGSRPWQEPFGPAGTVQAKVADALMAGRMELEAAMGHPCGMNFHAAEHLRRHPQFAWQEGLLGDLLAGPWTLFAAR
jgi:Phospholipase B